MSQDPQTLSISSSPPLSPDEIARKSFPVVRRGVDGDAVRIFLARVAAELRDLTEREAILRQRVVEAEHRAEEPELDEATLTRAIGIETAKILWTAHDAAKNVVTKAEERAAELLAEAEQVRAEQIAASDAEALETLTAARDEAAEVRSRAQAEAEALMANAMAEAARLSEDARLEADSLTEGAHADAIELLDATKEECRRMVAEARDMRSRTLADLAAKRRSLHVQLEELRTGRDSLLSVVDGVALSVEQVRERLSSAEDEARVAAVEAGRRVAEQPDKDISELEAELAAGGGGTAPGGPGNDEVGSPDFAAELVEQAEGGSGGTAAGVDLVEEGQEGPTASRRSVDELFARIRASRAAEESAASAAAAVEGSADAAAGEAGAGAPEGIYDIEAVTAAEAGAEVSADVTAERMAEAPIEAGEAISDEGPKTGSEAELAAAERDAELAAAGLEALEAAELVVEISREGDESPAAIAEESEEIAEIVDATVAAELASGDDPLSDAEAMTEPDVEALARRDHLLGFIVAKLGRALKRALQDDQNDLLNALRKTSRTPVLDELIPSNVQRERFVTAAQAQLAEAFEAGAEFLVAGDAVEGPSVTAPAPSKMAALEAGTLLAAELADDLSSLLRTRIELALSELDGGLEGSADAAGAAYREWKGTRVEGLAADFATKAFGAGELDVLGSLAKGEAPAVRWVVEDDDAGGSCPDCDDNSLAGPQPPGTEFPTGHVQPPVHPGCRCLLVPVRS